MALDVKRHSELSQVGPGGAVDGVRRVGHDVTRRF